MIFFPGDKLTATKPPQVDRILREPALVELASRLKRPIIAQLVREELSRLRREDEASAPDAAALAARVKDQAEKLLRPVMRKVINATGVVLDRKSVV